MKKIAKLLVLSLAMVTFFLLGTTSAKAAGITNTENVNYQDEVLGLTQTFAGTNTAGISWYPLAGATYYDVYTRVSGYSWQYTGIRVTSNSTTVNLPANTRCDVKVLANVEGYNYWNKDIELKTLPTSPNLCFSYAYWYINKLDFSWASMPAADGFQMQAKNSSGKVVRTVNSAYSNTYSNNTACLNGFEGTFLNIRVRGYITLNGTTFYGPWSNVRRVGAVAPTKMTCKYYRGSRKVIMKWKKVSGATKYGLYISKKDNKHYKKAATLSNKKTSYTFYKCGGARIKKNTKYYVKLVVYGKDGGKNVTSELSNAYYVNM
jgi:hypothetical protein